MVELVGRAGKRLVRLEVDERRIRWLSRKDEVQKEPEILDVPLASLTGFSVVTSRPNSWLLGAAMVGYAVWSMATRTDAGLLEGGIAFLGVALIVIDVTRRTAVLKAVSPEVTLMLTVDRPFLKAIPEVEALVLAVKPELRPAMSVVGYFGGELRALLASEAALVAEYRRSAGAKAIAAHEARYPRQRRRIAAWGLFWLMLFPLAGTALTLVLAPVSLSPWLVLRSLVELVALFFAGGWLQRRLAPVLAGWLKG